MRKRGLILFVLFLGMNAFSPFVFAASLTSSSELERLQAALEHYQNLATKDPWPVISFVKKLLLNDRDSSIALLRQRLTAEGYLDKSDVAVANSDFFDAEVDQALRLFQETHGLLVDGVLGKTTIAALNVSPARRVCQLQVALERLKSSSVVHEGRYLMVNIPDFSLTVFEGKKSVAHYRVIVGQRTKKTPLLKAAVSYLVINPDWRVPKDIAAKEELAKIQKDPDYFSNKKMKIFSVEEGKEAVEVDPNTVKWSELKEEDFSYRLVQEPGRGNALGVIKFIFPNRHDVYLHDTPDHSLFERADRALSHGCVRVDHPLDLGTYLLQENPKWSRDKIEEAIRYGKQKIVPLAEKVPIHLIYVTSWVNPDGTIQFRDDLYKYDKPLAKTVCSL